MEQLSVEQRILIMMRKTLACVVKDTTPLAGARHPLKESTIEAIRDCFAMIAAREQALSKSAQKAQPRFADTPRDSHVIPMATLKSARKTTKK